MLKITPRLVAAWAVVVVAVVFLSYGASLSHSYKECEGQRAQGYADKNNGDFLEQSGSFFVCEGVTIDANGELLTAIGTLIIALFTATLWAATTHESSLSKAALKLARDEFNATQRPRLAVRNVYWDGPHVTLLLVNQGSSTARVVETRFEFDRTDRRPILPRGENVVGNIELKRGAFTTNTVVVAEAHGFIIGAFEMGLVEQVTFQGAVIYEDSERTRYRMVFKRVCKKGGTTFERTQDPDDEYSD